MAHLLPSEATVDIVEDTTPIAYANRGPWDTTLTTSAEWRSALRHSCQGTVDTVYVPIIFRRRGSYMP